MQRSEMLEILEEAMGDYFDYATDTGATYDYDGILSELEKAGMLPPTRLEFYGPASEVNCDLYRKVNKWEPEDKDDNGSASIEQLYEYEILMDPRDD